MAARFAKPASSARRLARPLLALACSLLLCASGVPAAAFGGASGAGRAFADDAGALVPGFASDGLAGALGVSSATGSAAGMVSQRISALFPQAAGEADLNALWSAQDGGTDASLTITAGGVYALSADLSAKAGIVVDAPGAEVEIKLGGHSLTIADENGPKAAIDVRAASRAAVSGDPERKSKLRLEAVAVQSGIASRADALEVSGVAVEVVQNDRFLVRKDLNAAAVRATAGTVSVAGCSLLVDLSNQTATSGTNSDVSGIPAGIYLDAGVKSADIRSTSAIVRGSQCLGVDGAKGIETGGYAYGLYAKTLNRVKASKCSLDVASAQGRAVGMYGANLLVDASAAADEGDTAATVMKLEARERCIGVHAPAAGSVTLDAPLEVECADVPADDELGLYGAVGNAFVLGPAFAAEGLSVRIGEDAESSNGAGVRIASFGAGVPAARALAFASCLADAKGDASACSVAADSTGLYFRFDPAKAPAAVVRDGREVRYATCAEALASLSSGDLLRFLKDAGDVSFSPAGAVEGSSYSIDLAGHSLESLTVGTPGSVEVLSSEPGGSVRPAPCATGAAVTHSGSGPLSLSGLSIDMVATSGKAYGVLASGTGLLSLSDVDVRAASSADGAWGVFQGNAKGGDVRIAGGSISAGTSVSSASAFGLQSRAASNSVSIDSCPVSAYGANGTVAGVEVRSKLSMRGSGSGRADVSVASSGEPAALFGIGASASGASISLSGCSVRVEPGIAGQGAGHWCVTSNGLSASLALDGACAFENGDGAHVRLSGQPMQLGEAFSLDSAGLVVWAEGSQDGPLARIAQPASAADGIASRISGASGSPWEGWGARALSSDGGCDIVWSRSPVALNETTGESYESLPGAFEDAADGDVVSLLGDSVVNGALACPVAVTLDLAGHVLSCNAAAKAAAGLDGTGAALAFTGAGASRIMDSAGGGELAITVGSPAETAGLAYQGISVSGSGSLSVDGCAVSVAYAGGTLLSSEPLVTLRGIAVRDASLALAGDASLSVRAAARDGAFGAVAVSGISALEGAGAVSIGPDASVDASNNAASPTLSTMGVRDLAPLDVEEGSALDAEIQEQFYLNAKFDSNNDDAGLEYGANVYYASSLNLPSGLAVWAYSDPVSQADAGKKAAVRASHVFVRSRRTEPLSAFGVEGGEGFSGAVSQQGAVSASTSAGYAFALYEPAGASWESAGDGLSARCGNGRFSVYAGRLDLRDFIDFGRDFDSPVVFGSEHNAFVGLIREYEPVAKPVAHLGDDFGNLAEEGRGALAAGADGAVRIAFGNIHAADGSAAPDEELTVPYGSTLAQAGAELPVAGDYELDGVAYRFVGWRALGLPYSYDPQALQGELAIGADVAVSSGAIVLSASYVAVAPGQHLVTFNVEHGVYACAVQDGDRPLFGECGSSSNAAVPAHITAEAGYALSFRGWAPGKRSDDVWAEGDPCLPSSLPPVHGDMAYSALYQRVFAHASATFWYFHDLADGWSYIPTVVGSIDWRRDAIEVAEGQARVGESFKRDGVHYTLLGWSSRMSDVEPMYVDSLPIEPGSSSGFSSATVRYGIYALQSEQVDVLFYVDGALHATARGVDATSTLNAAFAASDNPSEPAREGFSFRGWNTDAGASSYLYGNIRTVGSLAEDGGPVVLHAIWRSSSSSSMVTVRFYDDDMTTLLLRLDMPAGMTVERYYDEAYEPPKSEGKVFTGWVDENGERFSPSTSTVTGDLDVFATYRTEEASSGVLVSPVEGGLGPTASLSPSTLGGGSLAGGVTALASVRASAAAKPAAAQGSVEERSALAQALDEALAEGDGEAADASGLPFAVDGNAVGFVAVQLAAIAAVGAFVWWLLSRRRMGDEAEAQAIAPPEMAEIRF